MLLKRFLSICFGSAAFSAERDAEIAEIDTGINQLKKEFAAFLQAATVAIDDVSDGFPVDKEKKLNSASVKLKSARDEMRKFASCIEKLQKLGDTAAADHYQGELSKALRPNWFCQVDRLDQLASDDEYDIADLDLLKVPDLWRNQASEGAASAVVPISSLGR